MQLKKLYKKVKNWALSLWLLVFASRATKNATLIRSLEKLEDLSKWNIYQSANDCPYEVFKKCSVDKNYSLLGKAPAEVLNRAWISILSEVYVVSEDENVVGMISELAEIDALESKILRVKLWCKNLLEGWSEYAAEKLREQGYLFPFTIESYIDDIERTLRKLKNLENQRDMLVAHIKEQTEKKQVEKEGVSPYAAYDEHINQMEMAFKVPIDTSKLTALMYAIKLRDLKEFHRRNTKPTEE